LPDMSRKSLNTGIATNRSKLLDGRELSFLTMVMVKMIFSNPCDLTGCDNGLSERGLDWSWRPARQVRFPTETAVVPVSNGHVIS